MFDYLDEKLETVLGKKMGKFWRIILEECADDKTARLIKKRISCMLQLRSSMVKHLKNKRTTTTKNKSRLK